MAAIKEEIATKEEIEMVRKFFQATGGNATVNVIKVEEKTILVGISGYQFTLPITQPLIRKGLVESGFRTEVHMAKNYLGLTFNPCDNAASVVETDGIHFVLFWRTRYYLITPTDCPFAKKPLIYEISQHKHGRLNRLIHTAKRLCGNFPTINTIANSLYAIPSMMADEPDAKRSSTPSLFRNFTWLEL